MTEPQAVEVSGRAGEPIELPVGSTSATGHEWTLELPEQVELAGQSPALDAPAETRAGAATGSKLLVTAPVGQYELIARLARPWESEPVRTLKIVLTVT